MNRRYEPVDFFLCTSDSWIPCTPSTTSMLLKYCSNIIKVVPTQEVVKIMNNGEEDDNEDIDILLTDNCELSSLVSDSLKNQQVNGHDHIGFLMSGNNDWEPSSLVPDSLLSNIWNNSEDSSFQELVSITNNRQVENEHENNLLKVNVSLTSSCNLKDCREEDYTFKCSVCGKCFTRREGLYNHISYNNHQIHLAEKPLSCTVCGKSFSSKSSLKTHGRIHIGEKPYKCFQCSKCFAQRSNLKKHEMTHTGERPYKCSVCSKCFRDSSYLKTHEMIHTGEKPFNCKICNKWFRSNKDLKKHGKIHTRS